MRKPIAIAALAVSFACTTPALAGETAQGSARITATVPEVCDIAAGDFVLNEDGQVSGTVQEFCNSNTGYQILASHRPLAPSEVATVRYGGALRNLDLSGLSLVAFRAGQRIETVNVVIDARQITAPLAVAFTMSAV